LEAVSRAISETVNATLAQVGMQPEIQQWRIWGRLSPPLFWLIAFKRESRFKYLLCSYYSLNNSAAHTATGTTTTTTTTTTQRPR